MKMTLLQGDCLKGLPTLPSESIDLIVTDPPYGVNKENWDKIIDFNWIKECFRVLKDGGSFYCFYSSLKIPEIQNEISKYFIVKNVLVWYVTNNVPTFDRSRWAFRWQPIIFATKGKNHAIFLKGTSRKHTYEVLQYPTLIFTQVFHPTQKPQSLIEHLIDVSSNKGDIVLDPFLGSGTTMLASLQTGRNCIGIEINSDYINIIKKRINWNSSLSDKVEWEFCNLNGSKNV